MTKHIDDAIEQRTWKSADDLRTLKGPELVYAFNGLRLLVTPSPKEVGKFADKETAVKRVWALYEALPKSQNGELPSEPEQAPTPTAPEATNNEEADMATKKATKKAKTPKEKKAKTEAGKRGGRSPKFTADMKITKLVSENPFRAGAAKRFDLIRDGMTVGKYLELGGLMADLRWDVKVKAIKIT